DCITITNTGNGAVAYSVASNSTTARRIGTLTIAGQTFTVLQGIPFNDVPTDHPFYSFIEKFSAVGITSGCGGGNYCPDAPVTRAQMAIFLEKALGVFTPPTPVSGQQTFTDVPPGSFGYEFIEDFATRHITSG